VLYIRKFFPIVLLLLVGCAEKKKPVAVAPPPPPPVVAPKPVAPKPVAAKHEPRSQMPPETAEVIVHCVVTKQENANTVSCACVPLTTRIDSKTGHTEIVCQKTKEER
jgi:hypothetical protein